MAKDLIKSDATIKASKPKTTFRTLYRVRRPD